jgi:NADH:ubiquinone oxidoreductase subunit C
MTEVTRPPAAAMCDVEPTRPVAVSDLCAAAEAMATRNLRFVTATCLDMGATFDIYYHFADGVKLDNLLVTIPRDAELPSITASYLGAFLVENEMKELFGINVVDIGIDYNGRLFMTELDQAHPMAKVQSCAAPTVEGE